MSDPRHSLDKDPQIYFSAQAREIIRALSDSHPSFRSHREEYLAGKLDHVSFTERDISIDLLVTALTNAKDRENPRTFSEHGAEHKTFESVIDRLIFELKQQPKNVQIMQGEYDRDERYLPSPRLLVKTKEPVQGSRRVAIWAQLGSEIANRDNEKGGAKNRGKFLRSMAKEYGATFAILTAFYAGLDIPDIIAAFRDLSDVMTVPTQNRTVKLPDGRTFPDHAFLSHIRNVMTEAGKHLTFNWDRQRQAVEQMQLHPLWGNQSNGRVLGPGIFPAQYYPLAVFESFAKLVEDTAQAKQFDLQNTGLAQVLAERTEKIWTTNLVTAYRLFEGGAGNFLSPGNGAALREFLSTASED